jgi:aryl-alcohol dehydrogenase-like predicted oxidoreductase
VLSRGLLSGRWSRERSAEAKDFRALSPRFQGGNVERNLALVEALREIANEKRATVAQLAVAWVLSRGDDIVPLIGARKRDQLTDGLGALALDLTPDDLARIERAVPPDAASGERYPAMQMTHLDSERRA